MQAPIAEAVRIAPKRGFTPVRFLLGMLRFARRKPLGGVGLGILLFFAVIAVIGPSLAPFDPADTNARARMIAPNSTHFFGTDNLGRDIFSRTIYGARISIIVGVIVTVLASSIGAVLGVTSGYFGGKFDLIMQRFIDAKSAFPPLLLALALMAAFRPSLTSVIVALTIIFTSRGVRVIRSQVLSIKESPYIEACKAMGATSGRTMLLHVFPNTFGPFMVVSTVALGQVILLEASLSFLGVGMPVTVVSWGSMLSGDLLRNFPVAPWIGFAPGLALTLTVFGINVLGDALRDVMDPRLRGR